MIFLELAGLTVLLIIFAIGAWRAFTYIANKREKQ